MDNTDYVSYELALKLKECGFDKHTRAVWHFDGEDFNFIPDYGATFVHPRDIPHWNEPNAWGTHICSAPCLWEAQKWLRDEKRIEVNAFWCFSDEKWQGYYCPMNLPSLESEPNDEMYDSYEEALGSAISAALELIGKEEKL